MNNFIVGQVTPTMMSKLTFGTFVFFGVCYDRSIDPERSLLITVYKNSPSRSLEPCSSPYSCVQTSLPV